MIGVKNLMKKVALSLIVVIIASLFFANVIDAGIASSTKYTNVSDTERWYYEKVQYEAPYVGRWEYRDYYNATHYNISYLPYYYTGYSYRNVKVYEYYLKVNTDLTGATITGEGWYREGTSASISASKELDDGSETKYLFSYWSGDSSGNSPSGSVTMDRPKTTIANYRAIHHLLARSSPANVLGFMEDNWYDEGTSKILQSAPEIVKADQGKRYVFDSWYVDGGKVAGNPLSISVDKPYVAEAKYGTQYYLDVKSLYGNPIGAGWYGEDSTAKFEVTTPVKAGFGKEWVFERWSGSVVTASPQGTTVMDGSKAITAAWKLDSTILYVTYGAIISAAIAVVAILGLLLTRPGTGTHVFKSRQACPRCEYAPVGSLNFCPNCGTKRVEKRR